jgi:hypothetical protein
MDTHPTDMLRVKIQSMDMTLRLGCEITEESTMIINTVPESRTVLAVVSRN